MTPCRKALSRRQVSGGRAPMARGSVEGSPRKARGEVWAGWPGREGAAARGDRAGRRGAGLESGRGEAPSPPSQETEAPYGSSRPAAPAASCLPPLPLGAARQVSQASRQELGGLSLPGRRWWPPFGGASVQFIRLCPLGVLRILAGWEKSGENRDFVWEQLTLTWTPYTIFYGKQF